MKQFICQTPSCAIAISKAEFPVSMNCPLCQTPLTEAVKSLTQKDLDLIASLPYVIAYPLKRTLLEKHAWTKINLLKDTFQNYLKYLGLLSASEFFNSELKDKGMIALFDSQFIVFFTLSLLPITIGPRRKIKNTKEKKNTKMQAEMPM